MLDTTSLPHTIADATVAESFTLTEMELTHTDYIDENELYQDLSKQLLDLERSLEVQQEPLQKIREQAVAFIRLIDEKQEIFLRIDWLDRLYRVKEEIETIDSIEKLTQSRKQLASVQTCPLKKELMERLDALEKTFEKEETKLSPKDALIEAIFETGNTTFINLGTTGRDVVIKEVLNGDGKVETAIAKAEALEAAVQAVKQHQTIEALRTALEELPLKQYQNIPAEYEAEVLQKLLDNPNWNGLFHLDRLIQQYTIQVKHVHEPKQEGVQTTLVMNDKLIKQLGLQQA